jgi:transcriptional regulator with XRE-family HTH domain
VKEKFLVRGTGTVLANLKATLAVRRIRQVDLAIQLKISSSVLSEIINGRRPLPQDLAERIAGALNADPNWLFSPLMDIPVNPCSDTDQTVVVATS